MTEEGPGGRGEALLEHLRRAASLSQIEVEEFVLPEEHDVVVGRMRLHYLDWGGSGRPVLFLHGGGLTAHTWNLPCLALRPRYRCLALDLRGHGDSEWSPEMDYSIETYVRDVEGFVDQLGLDRLLLVGMSLGGMISVGYASRHSERLKGLVVIDISFNVHVDAGTKIRDFLALEPELPSLEAFVERALAFNSRRRPELLRESLLSNLRQLPNGNLAWKYDHRHYASLDVEAAVAERRALFEGVPSIGCPTLIVRGGESDMLLPADADDFVRMLPDGRWTTVGGAGHTVQGDNPGGLVAVLEAFFGEVDARA